MTSPHADRALASAITGDDIVAAFHAAIQATDTAEQPPTHLPVEIYDNFWNPQGFGGDHIELQVSFPRLKLPTGALKLIGDDPAATLAVNCWQTFVGVTVQVGAIRWAGWIDLAEDKINEDGTETVDCTLVGILTILDRILVYPQPALPLAIQPSAAIYIGAGITCLKAMVAENAFRLQSDWMEFFNTVISLDLDWRTWFDSFNLPGNEWEYVPVFVPPWDPSEDTSYWTAFHGRMDTCWKLMRQHLQDNGWYASLDLWLPQDPQPSWTIAGITTEANLKVPSYILNIRDYSGVSGPAGNWTDGLTKDLVTLEGSILGQNVVGPVQEYVPPGSNIEIAPIYGVNYTPPWVIFNADADQPGLISMNIAQHAPQAYRVTLGGQSPAWLSAALNATMQYAVDMLTIAIGVGGIPGNLLDGILDGTFLAFQLFVNYTAQHQLGPYAPPEKFFPTQSTYDIDMLFSAIDALWAVRGYPAAQFSFINGLPFTVGRDIFPGAQSSVIRRGIVYTDYNDDITVIDSPEAFAKVTVQVGDGKREEAPGLIYLRKFTELEENINLLLLAPPGGSG